MKVKLINEYAKGSPSFSFVCFSCVKMRTDSWWCVAVVIFGVGFRFEPKEYKAYKDVIFAGTKVTFNAKDFGIVPTKPKGEG